RHPGGGDHHRPGPAQPPHHLVVGFGHRAPRRLRAVPGGQAGDRRVLLHRHRHPGQGGAAEILLLVDLLRFGHRLAVADDPERTQLPLMSVDVVQVVGHHLGGRNIAPAHRPGALLGGGANHVHSPSSAWSRSASRSSTVSIPTDSRTRSSGTAKGEPATEAWVIRAGCSINDSTPPSDSASRNSLARLQASTAAGAPPASRNDTMPPKRRICPAATLCPGWLGSPG